MNFDKESKSVFFFFFFFFFFWGGGGGGGGGGGEGGAWDQGPLFCSKFLLKFSGIIIKSFLIFFLSNFS